VWDEAAARARLDAAIAYSAAPETEVALTVTRLQSTRFAEGEITQSLAEERSEVSIRAALGRRTARVTTDRADEAGVTASVVGAAELARAQPEDPQLLPLAEPEAAPVVARFHPATAALSPSARAEAIREMVGEAAARGLVLAGVYANGETGHALANSRGLWASHRESQVEFSVTALSPTSSGWAKATETCTDRLDVIALARRAMDKAEAMRHKAELPPGEYTVILEPSAVTDLFGFLFADWGGQAVEEQRSFLAGHVGEALFGANVTIADDVLDPRQSGPPWDGEGVPRRRVPLVEGGVVKGLVYSRGAAARAGTAPTGHGFPLPNELGEMPVNIVMAGGDVSLERMIEGTARGVLVSRFWYVREVDPMTKWLTGMTRDGTFLIEDGRVRSGLSDLRFNQGLLAMLRSVVALGPAVRASGEEGFDMVVPAMKVEGFRFTGSTGA
jgi:predicted Zn-dependent protease